MWNMDFDSLIQLLMIVVFVGVGILQLLYRVFVKPAANAEAKRRQMEQKGQDPSRTLRDFLAEVRGEAPARPAPEAREQGALRDEPVRDDRRLEEELVEARWEDVQDEVPPPLPPRAPRVPPPAPSPPGRRAARPAAKKAARVSPEARMKARERLESAATKEKFAFSGGILETRGAESGAGPQVEMQERHVGRLTSGLSLRDAILAQVIIGPPRARMGKRPPRGGWTRA